MILRRKLRKLTAKSVQAGSPSTLSFNKDGVVVDADGKPVKTVPIKEGWKD
jgi:hypothetical protein